MKWDRLVLRGVLQKVDSPLENANQHQGSFLNVHTGLFSLNMEIDAFSAVGLSQQEASQPELRAPHFPLGVLSWETRGSRLWRIPG